MTQIEQITTEKICVNHALSVSSVFITKNQNKEK